LPARKKLLTEWDSLPEREAAFHPRDFECPGAQVLHVEIRDLISNSPRLEGLTSAAYRTMSLS